MAKVAVIGCGLMGSALARALRRGGNEVGGFDLDPARLRALAAEGIGSHGSVGEAFAAAELVVINVPTYAHVRQVFDEVGGQAPWPATVVNLVTGTPKEARVSAATVASHGAAYLEGAIFTYPPDVGSAEAMVVFSGPAETWERNREALISLGGASIHVGDDVGAANVVDTAMAGAFFTVGLAAFAEAAAYIRAEGVDLRAALPAARREAAQILADVDGAAEAILSGDHATEEATLDVFLEAAEAWSGAMAEANQRGALMAAATASMRRAHDAGRGGLGFFVQVETLND